MDSGQTFKDNLQTETTLGLYIPVCVLLKKEQTMSLPTTGLWNNILHDYLFLVLSYSKKYNNTDSEARQHGC